MKAVYDIDFGMNNSNAIWSGIKVVTRNFDEALAKAKKERDRQVKDGIRGLKIISVKRVMVVDE